MIGNLQSFMFNLLTTPPSADGIDKQHTPYNILGEYGGWLRMYPIFITLGIFAAIFACYVRMKLRNLPSEPLMWSTIFIIPMALLGASFFGKLNGDPTHPWSANKGDTPFFSLFKFWEQGLSIHGGVLFGALTGIVTFGFFARRVGVSMFVYLDCIAPNILLGQVIGRWGNFFNHELLGKKVSYDSLSWLPRFIRDNSWQWADSGAANYPESIDHQIIFREPIFLYESMANFALWIILIFVLPNIIRWFGRKPWKDDPINFHYDMKYNWQVLFRKKPYDPTISMSWLKIWDKAININTPNQKETLAVLDQANKYREDHKNPTMINKIKTWWFDERYFLTKLYDSPYQKLRVGVQGSLYLFGWNLIRFILETRREGGGDLFIMNNRPLDYAVLILIALSGILLALFAQYYAPYKLRKPGYLYEREYIDYTDLSKWRLDQYICNNIQIGVENTTDNIENSIKKYTMQYLGYEEKNFEDLFEMHLKPLNNFGENELVRFAVTIKSVTHDYINSNYVGVDLRYDLHKILNNQKIIVMNNKLTQDELIAIIDKIIHSHKDQLKTYWMHHFNNIDWEKTKILDLKASDLVNLKRDLPFTAKSIYVSKFLFNETAFYYVGKKIKLKRQEIKIEN